MKDSEIFSQKIFFSFNFIILLRIVLNFGLKMQNLLIEEFIFFKEILIMVNFFLKLILKTDDLGPQVNLCNWTLCVL
jgi:hypothetical protein